jgi:hypothetical protein
LSCIRIQIVENGYKTSSPLRCSSATMLPVSLTRYHPTAVEIEFVIFHTFEFRTDDGIFHSIDVDITHRKDTGGRRGR